MNQSRENNTYKILFVLATGIGLYLISLVNYLLFHSLAELFSVMIGATMFIITWYAREYTREHFDFLAFVSVSYLFVALMDVLHTLAYQGMAVFPDADFFANQLWVAARYMESLSILVGLLLMRKPRKTNLVLVFMFYAGLTLAISLSVFVFKIFPVCYVAGKGQTSFKIISEFIIIGILLVDVYLLNRSGDQFDATVSRNLNISLMAAIGTELCFTLYLSNYDWVNLAGHYLKIISFYFLSRAVVYTSIQKPYATIFRRLTEKEAALEQVSLTDELTGLYNRRAALTFLGKTLNQIQHSGGELTICFIDVDGLKRTNDRLGHLAGDDLLVTVARLLDQTVRESDYACRIGGDEFLLLLPQTTETEAQALLRRVHDARDQINRRNEKPFPVDFSMGLAYASQERLAHASLEQVMDQLLEEADDRMYADKKSKQAADLSKA
ncbi:MAG: GGDEF domain-containing protein [Eubacteriales bacterium]|nr:GGDEF domain-containing protein [Eubacteriales bacterium]